MNVGEMQRKLAVWSTENRERKFDRLLRVIANREWLMEAATKTLASAGAKTAGIDGVVRDRLKPNLAHEIERLRRELLDGSYRPHPVRRVFIPKQNGKLRPLGIPTLRDRIVQRAMVMVMEPIWESDFHRNSYGFRPRRSVHHAIQAVAAQLTDAGRGRMKGRWVIEGDLASYFDTVHHRKLVGCIKRRIRAKSQAVSPSRNSHARTMQSTRWSGRRSHCPSRRNLASPFPNPVSKTSPASLCSSCDASTATANGVSRSSPR